MQLTITIDRELWRTMVEVMEREMLRHQDENGIDNDTVIYYGERLAEAQASEKPAPSWEPDWSGIPAKYRWCAADGDGAIMAYTHRPECCREAWSLRLTDRSKGGMRHNTGKRLPVGIDWRSTLRSRP